MHKEVIHPDELMYLKFRTHQHNGLEDEDIARDFDLPTPKALYANLAEDGFPVCKYCGAYTKNHSCTEMREVRAPKRERKAKASGDQEIVKLPPARAAVSFFEDMINPIALDAKPLIENSDDPRYGRITWQILRVTLKEYLMDLECLEEELHGGNRFISTSIEEDFDMDTGPYTAVVPGGGHPYPNRRLVVLIATYALLYGKVGPLIEVLHPDPASIDRDSWDKVNEVVKNLSTEARKLARWVRGAVVKQSPPTADLSLGEQQNAWEITRLREEGLADEEIRRQLRPISLNEIKRLGAFNLRRPNP